MYSFCFVTSLMDVNRPNAGKDNDDVKMTSLFIYVSESKGFSLLPTSNKCNLKTTIITWHHCTIQIIFNIQESKN
jgi:hypothetical protein